VTESPFRPNLYVVARFLDHLAARSHTRSTLQAAVGVNYDIFRRYLEFLAARGLVAIQPREGSDGVRLTPQGHEVRSDLLGIIARFLEESPLVPPRPEPRAAPAPAGLRRPEPEGDG
jgi:predicted transcriptional regulator